MDQSRIFRNSTDRRANVTSSVIVSATMIIACAGIATAQTPPEYHVTPLKSPRGMTNVEATDLNDYGHVAALWAAQPPLAFHGYMYLRDRPIPVPSLNQGGADHLHGLNNRGVGVGAQLGGIQSGQFPLAWTRHGIHSLPLDFGFSQGIARCINDANVVAGYLHSGDITEAVPVRWLEGRVEQLGDLGGDGSGLAQDINASGQVVGRSQTAEGVNHAFLWNDGDMMDLGVTGGSERSEALAVNDRGEVVGQLFTPATRAFRWDSTNGMQLLGGLPDAVNWTGFDINNVGAIVGSSTGDFSGTHATLYWIDRSTYDLNTLHDGSLPSDLDIIRATHVNNRGRILAIGHDRINRTNTLLILTPTCAVDLVPDNTLNRDDFVEFRRLFRARDPIADWNGDDRFTREDIDLYRRDLRDGC